MSDAREIAKQLTARLMLLIDQPEGTERAIVMIAAALAAAEARVRQENELLRKKALDWNAEADKYLGQRDVLQLQVEALSAHLAAVEQALREYGQHTPFCEAEAWEARNRIYKPNYPRPKCTCGLSAALGDPQ